MSTSKKQTAIYAVNLVPQWLRGASPEAQEAIADVMSQEFTRLMESEGVRAFEMPRTAACAHETGHAIMETMLGAHVKSVEIHICPKLSRLGVSDAWGGRVCCHGDTGWSIEEDTPVREIRHRVYRMVAGFAGECVLDPGNVRSGSSLDERVVGQLISTGVHEREGRSGHPRETWNECWGWVLAAIKHNADIGRQLMAKLDAVKLVKGKPLDAILRRVRLIDTATTRQRFEP
jgi:hypothetical protein